MKPWKVSFLRIVKNHSVWKQFLEAHLHYIRLKCLYFLNKDLYSRRVVSIKLYGGLFWVIAIVEFSPYATRVDFKVLIPKLSASNRVLNTKYKTEVCFPLQN